LAALADFTFTEVAVPDALFPSATTDNIKANTD
jgi:hypothetical protein